MDYTPQRVKLVDRLVLGGYLKTASVISAMRKVPREEFIPEGMRGVAYADRPLPIGYDQTISAPHMVAIMTEALLVEPNNKILEVGSGSGYQAAVLAELAVNGFVYTVERVKQLVGWSSERLKACGLKNVMVLKGDGTVGLLNYSPYDRIIVTAAAPRIPKALVEQLSCEGKLLVPVGGHGYQDLMRITKRKDGLIEENLGGCVFVPLIGEDGW
jgi:protein-L-isoaspartate(D-aspartate) O-methyltransferase